MSCVSNANAREIQQVPRTRRTVCFHDEFGTLSVMILCLEHHAEMPAEIPRLSRGLAVRADQIWTLRKGLGLTWSHGQKLSTIPEETRATSVHDYRKKQCLSKIEVRCKQPWLEFMHNLVKRNQPPQ